MCKLLEAIISAVLQVFNLFVFAGFQDLFQILCG